jgi:hypothetical protein
MIQHKVLSVVIFVLLAGGCASEEPSTAPTTPHPFSDELVALVVKPAVEIGGSEGSYHTLSICQHTAWSTYGGGLFTVRELVGIAEPDGAGSVAGYTYIVLSTDEVWYGDLRDEEVVRVQGGPTGEGTFTGTFVELQVGDRVAMLLRGDTLSWNEGFPSTDPMRLFHLAPGRDDVWVVSGAEYATATLRSAVQAASSTFRADEFSTGYCGVDVDFDRCPEQSLIPPGAVFFDEPCEDDRVRPDSDPSDLGAPSDEDMPIDLEVGVE